MPPTTPQALRTLKAAHTALTKAETKFHEAAGKRNAALLEARKSGATYADLQRATGLSVSAVTQTLRKARKALLG